MKRAATSLAALKEVRDQNSLQDIDIATLRWQGKKDGKNV
jgi:hypothetical protein